MTLLLVPLAIAIRHWPESQTEPLACMAPKLRVTQKIHHPPLSPNTEPHSCPTPPSGRSLARGAGILAHPCCVSPVNNNTRTHLGMDTSTQQALVQLVDATRLVATRTSLVHAGAPSLLGQLLPTALQLWSQDGLPSRHKEGSQNQEQDTAVLLSSSRQLSATATRLAAETSSSGDGAMPQHCAAVTAVSAQAPLARSASEQGCGDTLIKPRMLDEKQLSADAAECRRPESQLSSSRGHNSQLELSSYGDHSEADVEPCDSTCGLSESMASQHLDSWDRDASLAHCGECSREGQPATAAPAPDSVRRCMNAADYLIIEEDEDSGGVAADEPRDSVDFMSAMSLMSPACQQLLLLLRVLRNLCATGSEATQALAEVGVPAQVAHLVSTSIQSATEGERTQHACCAASWVKCAWQSA